MNTRKAFTNNAWCTESTSNITYYYLNEATDIKYLEERPAHDTQISSPCSQEHLKYLSKRASRMPEAAPSSTPNSASPQASSTSPRCF